MRKAICTVLIIVSFFSFVMPASVFAEENSTATLDMIGIGIGLLFTIGAVILGVSDMNANNVEKKKVKLEIEELEKKINKSGFTVPAE